MTKGDPKARALCLRNSLDWYESVFRSHCLESAVANTVWACAGTPPPYYSRVITLAPHDPEDQISIIRGIRSSTPGPFTVKDSFAGLDLAPLGFRVLFEAEWIYRDPADAPPRQPPTGLSWRRVTAPDDLARWESAWARNGSPAATRVFLPRLLGDDSVALFAAHRGDRLVAGCAANRSAGAVGFSNFFSEEGDHDSLVAEALANVSGLAPALAIVGYETREAPSWVHRLGFRTVGPLRVWISEHP